jgi:prophage regulatory protein
MPTTFREMALDLVGVAEITQMLGVSRQYVDRLTRGSGFPVPEAELASGRVWKREDVESWARATGRLK